MRYRQLLVAFDGSPESELALAHAIAFAHVNRARLALVGVAQPLLVRAGHDGLEPRLQAAADAVPDDLRPTARLLSGDPVREILRAAADVDAVFMGAGRVAEQVMADAPVPVIVVHCPPGGPDLAA